MKYKMSRVFPCRRQDRQTDRHDEANSLLSQFCECALKSRHYFGGLILQILLTKTAGVLSYIYIRIPQTTVHFSMTFLPQPTRSCGEVFFLHLRLHIQALSDAWTQFTFVTRQGTNCWQLVTNHSTDWQLVTNHSTDWQLVTNHSTDWQLVSNHSTDWQLVTNHSTDL
jgi:hypothetical protein